MEFDRSRRPPSPPPAMTPDPDFPAPTRPRLRGPGAARAVLGVLVLTSLVLAVHLLLFPEDFYREFPLGYAWMPPLGPYNDHVIRDYGSMNLGAGAGAIYAWVTLHPHAVRAVAAVFAVGSLPHAVYHAAMWRMSGVLPAALQASLLVAVAVLALVLIPLSTVVTGSAAPDHERA